MEGKPPPKKTHTIFCSKTLEDGLYNPFFTVNFRPKLEVNKGASWSSYCPIFPFTVFVMSSIYACMYIAAFLNHVIEIKTYRKYVHTEFGAFSAKYFLVWRASKFYFCKMHFLNFGILSSNFCACLWINFAKRWIHKFLHGRDR